MIEISHNEVRIGIERNPITEILSTIDKEATVKAVIEKDLTSLFIAFIQKYDIGTTATLIHRSLETAQEVTKNAEVDIREREEDGSV